MFREVVSLRGRWLVVWRPTQVLVCLPATWQTSTGLLALLVKLHARKVEAEGEEKERVWWSGMNPVRPKLCPVMRKEFFKRSSYNSVHINKKINCFFFLAL